MHALQQQVLLLCCFHHRTQVLLATLPHVRLGQQEPAEDTWGQTRHRNVQRFDEIKVHSLSGGLPEEAALCALRV